jgi:thiol-disulfide isomerase/thioredoxin
LIYPLRCFEKNCPNRKENPKDKPIKKQKHMRSLITLPVMLLLFITSCAQNSPVPDYMTTQPFPDTVRNVALVRPDGSEVALGNVLDGTKGRKVLVDMWASWCRDCIVGLPDVKSLQKSFGNNVVFLFLSVDKDDAKWKSAIERYGISGEHYRVKGAWKTPLSNYIALDWIPRYLVLDENGMVIQPKAIHANDASLKEALSKGNP